MEDEKTSKIVEKAEKIRESLFGNGGYFNYRFLEDTISLNEEEKEKYIESYRYICEKEPDEDSCSWVDYELVEVYYDGDGNIIAWSEGPVSLWCENRKDLKDILKKAKQASYKTTVAIIDGKMIDTGRKMPKNWKK